MAYLFSDGFDFYTAIADMTTYWDSAASFVFFTPGRFANSQCIRGSSNNVTYLTKASGSNDATHHIVVAHYNSSYVAGTGCVGFGLTLRDAATAQCTITFRYDGIIELRSGTVTGSVLATTPALFPQAIWTSLEFEVTIHASAGTFTVRKNGNTSNDYSATGLATALSGHNYANSLAVVMGATTGGTVGSSYLDDLLWFNTSGNAPNTWVGDVRAYQLMPTTSVSQQFSISPTLLTQNINLPSGTFPQPGNGVATYTPFVASYSGTVGSILLYINSQVGNVKLALFNSSLGTVLATAPAFSWPGSPAGWYTFTFSSPPTIAKGTTYYIGVDQDSGIQYNTGGATNAIRSSTSYASFPVASPSNLIVASPALGHVLNVTLSDNANLVSESQQDGTVTYVYDSTVGHGDLYAIAALPTNAGTVIAVTTRGFMEKSDAGARSGQLQLKSGVTTVTSTPLLLSSSFAWNTRTDTVDPNTSSAWTRSNVNLIQIGPVVQA